MPKLSLQQQQQVENWKLKIVINVVVCEMGQSERYELLSEIGKGNFGTVLKARDTKDGKIVAIKVIDLEEAEQIQKEITAQASCDSEFITKYYESFIEVFLSNTSFCHSKCDF